VVVRLLFEQSESPLVITINFLVDNLCSLLFEATEAPDPGTIHAAIEKKDALQAGKLIQIIARDIRARVSTLPFPEDHQFGGDPPSRQLGMATRYMDEIGCALAGKPKDQFNEPETFDEFGWHAFGAAIQAIAGLLMHLERDVKKKAE